MDFEQVRQYWEDRAAADSSAQSTTQDVYLREIEFRVLREVIDRYAPATVLDVGCGDARTTARLAAGFGGIKFTGGDYSESMVRNARAIVAQARMENLEVSLADVTQPLSGGPWDLVYSTRCLINLPSWELQQTAIRNIAEALAAGGVYAMIENFVEGQDNFNRARRDFELPEIPVREHNRYFGRDRLLEFVSRSFDVVDEINISSTYYLVSRVVYSRICREQGNEPDYFDAHHKYAAHLPFCGEYGPVRLVCMKRR